MNFLNISSPILMLCLGAAFLFLGYRLVKVVAVVNLAVLGLVVGRAVGARLGLEPRILGAAIGGLLFALLAIPLLRAAVVVAMAALAGLVAKKAWVPLGGAPGGQWLALAGGFVLGAILALVFYRFIMIATSSIMGSGLVVYGAASLMQGRLLSDQDLETAPPARNLLMIGVFIALALAGIVVQYRGARRRPAKPVDSR